jgi:hypothetical protein
MTFDRTDVGSFCCKSEHNSYDFEFGMNTDKFWLTKAFGSTCEARPLHLVVVYLANPVISAPSMHWFFTNHGVCDICSPV